MYAADLSQKEAGKQTNKIVHGSEVKRMIRERKQYLEQVKQEKLLAVQKAPAGKLRVDWRKGKPQYYYRSSKEIRNGIYIPKAQNEKVGILAQKEYDERVLSAAVQELCVLEKALTRLPEKTADDIYEMLPDHRKELIRPLEEPDQVFARKWKEPEYTGKDFAPNDPKLFTERGERVRSKSELIIANLLNQEGIPYRYEYPVSLRGTGTVYPDFTVLNIRRRDELIWEHLGMMDDPVYAEHAILKIQSYIYNGFFPGENLILTAETKQIPLNMKMIKTMIHRCCM